MLGKGHAASGVALWLAGWAWATTAGLADPGVDVLTIGSLVCAGSALAPDVDHAESRIAYSGGPVTRWLAKTVGRTGHVVHELTRLRADKPDLDGHRTITHTFAFAATLGALITLLNTSFDDIGRWLTDTTGWPIAFLGRLPSALVVYALVNLGYTAARAAAGGRQAKIKLLGRRWRKGTVAAGIAATYTWLTLDSGVWWIGVAVGVGCAIHCLGDMITIGGCPILWPLPIPRTELRTVRRVKTRVRVWRTWYRVGTPRWMRFPVGGKTEKLVTDAVIALAVLAVLGLGYLLYWPTGPAAAR
jgi:membrane-bound metal-dependent hydrolase YbcI (DUF457 family)